MSRALQHGDIPFKAVIALSSLTLLALMVGVGVMLWLRSEPTRAQMGWSFITQTTWNPVGEVFGAVPFIVGTLATSLVAVLIALPLGLGISIFLAELCPPQLRTVHRLHGRTAGGDPQRGVWRVGHLCLYPAIRHAAGHLADEHLGHGRAALSRPVLWRQLASPPG